MDAFSIPIPWWIAGPLLGVSVAGLYATINRPLGVSGAYQSVIDAARGRASWNAWRIWFLAGTMLGAFLVAVLAGSSQKGLAYGTLGEALSLPVLILVLFAGSVLIGFGARIAGGCTSGHGLTGCASRSPASFVAIGAIMISAVSCTLLFSAVFGS